MSTVCHPHMLTQDPERLLQGELEDMEIAVDEEPAEDAPISDPKKVQAPA